MYYSRDEIVEAITDYYKFLCRTIHPPDALKMPPPGGWEEITPESMRSLNKPDYVVDVIRHLPYIDRDNTGECHIVPETTPIDFPTPSSLEEARTGDLRLLQPKVSDDEVLPPDCLCIAIGRSHAYTLFLDLTNGTIIWYNNDGGWEGESHDMGEEMDREEDPRCAESYSQDWPEWRDEPTYDLKYFFGVFCRKRITRMNWIGRPDGELRVTDPRRLDDKDLLRRQMLIDAGFPGDENGVGFDWQKWRDDERHRNL